MASRPPASTSASAQPAAPLYPSRENTARVAMRGNVLPGWFWGLLGCLSVLGVGMAALLVFTHGSASGAAVATGPITAAPAAPIGVAAAGPAQQPQPRSGIEVQPMAPPPAPAAIAPAADPAPRAHAAHVMKLARSPAGLHPSAGAPASGDRDNDKTPAAAEDGVAAKKPASAAAADDDQPARRHKPAASDEDDDDDSDE